MSFADSAPVFSVGFDMTRKTFVTTAVTNTPEQFNQVVRTAFEAGAFVLNQIPDQHFPQAVIIVHPHPMQLADDLARNFPQLSETGWHNLYSAAAKMCGVYAKDHRFTISGKDNKFTVTVIPINSDQAHILLTLIQIPEFLHPQRTTNIFYGTGKHNPEAWCGNCGLVEFTFDKSDQVSALIAKLNEHGFQLSKADTQRQLESAIATARPLTPAHS